MKLIDFSPQVVCPEKYLGASANGKCHKSTWDLDRDPQKCGEQAMSPDWGELLTVILYPRHYLTAREVKEQLVSEEYQGVRVHIASVVDSNSVEERGLPDEVTIVESHGDAPWSALAWSVRTPYVLVGRDLHSLWKWARLERSIRLLQGDASIGAVAGSYR